MAKRITFEGELQLGHLSMLAAASARELYVEELHRLAEKDERIVFVGADSGYSGAENKFREKYPDRMLPVGIAEQDQVGVAAGLALCGKIPYISGFGPFLALRTLDQVHTNVCYPNLPVRIVNTHSGLTSASGPTHAYPPQYDLRHSQRRQSMRQIDPEERGSPRPHVYPDCPGRRASGLHGGLRV